MNHSFNVEFAVKYGLSEAILFENIRCECMAYDNKLFYDNTFWTCNSLADFKAKFPYLTIYGIRKALKNLEKANLVLVGNYNKTKYDHTLWYSIVEKQGG